MALRTHCRCGIVFVTALVGMFLVICSLSPYAQAEFPQLRLETVVPAGTLRSPVGLMGAGDGSGRLFTIDQRGKIEIIQGGSVLGTPFLDIGGKLVSQRPGFDERGLLGLAFHPDYAANGKLYVYYSAPRPGGDPSDPVNPIDHQSIVAEYIVSGNPNIANAASERILLQFDEPQFNHDGGQLAFGPDGKLYISTGDGGGSNDNNAGHTGGSNAKPNGGLGNGQDKTRLLGKILRIDVNDNSAGEYGIPGNNPLVGLGGGVREEIYAWGLRNPWRFSFDDGPGGTGRLYCADVGQALWEEVDIIESGKNYGWRAREGLHAFDATTPNPDNELYIDPIHEYGHGDPGTTIVGGFVYRGTAIPELVGKYIFADWSNTFAAPGNGTLLGLEETSPGVWSRTTLDLMDNNPIGLFITALGEDDNGELYVVAKSALDPGLDPNTGLPGGVIYRIEAIPEPGTLLLVGSGVGLLIARLRKRRTR